MKRSDRIIGKLLALTAFTVAGFLALDLAELGIEAGPFELLLALFMFFAISAIAYEALGGSFALVLAKGREAWERRFGPPERSSRGSRASERRYRPLSALGTLAAYIGGTLSVGFVVMLAAALAWDGPDAGTGEFVVGFLPIALLLSILGGGISAGLAYLRSSTEYDRAIAARWLRAGNPRAFLGSVALGLAGAVLFVVTVPWLIPPHGVEPTALWRLLEGSSGMDEMIVIVAMVGVAPVIEELVFRGIMLDGFLERWTPFVSVLVVTMLFVLMHVPAVLIYWPSAALIGAVGAGAAYARLDAGAIGPSIGLHLGYNLGVVSLWVL